MSQLVTAKLRYLHIAPRKVGLVVNALKGLSVNEAEAQLLFRAKRSSEPVLKLLRSAVANAKNNFKLDPETLIIKEVRVDQGPMIKRFLPRAQGRATPIHKKMSHVSIVLESKAKPKAARFTIATKAKKPKKEHEERKAAPKAETKPSQKEITAATNAPKEAKAKKGGIVKRMFNRNKSV
ncbi:50S ribosomal protein L22 [Patescibacteria group bacterium]|nr:50S ribosomal protein L22 [Patescibacteria group bacterium]